MSNTPLALALIQTEALRTSVQAHLPDFRWVWELSLTGAIQTAADLRPSVLLVEVDAQETGWEKIVLALKSSPATRRIPILGIIQPESHINNPHIQQNPVFGGFIMQDEIPARLAEWVAQRARVWDEDYYTALEQHCQQPLPELAAQGVALFNAREFWEAHEVLEQAWLEAAGQPVGELYRAILQVGVAYYQIQRGNYRGALKMFLRAVQWLDPLPDVCQGLDMAQFKQDAADSRMALESLGAEDIALFDQERYFKPVPVAG